MAGRGTNLGAQAVLMVGGLAAAAAARKVVNVVWVAVTGRRVPQDPNDPGVSTSEAIAFAVASAATVGTAKLLVARKANALKGSAGKGSAVVSSADVSSADVSSAENIDG